MTDQQAVAGGITTRAWATGTSVGFGLAFLSFIPGMLVMDIFLPEGLTNMGASPMPEALDPESLPAWLDPQTYRSWYRLHLGYHIAALTVFGGIVGWCQSRVLRPYVPALPWLGATAAGFVAILGFEILEPHVVVGPHAGPIEPLMISIGGSTMAGLAQWMVLRRGGRSAGRWLALWIVGVVVGVGVAVAAIIGLQAAIQPFVDPTSFGLVAQVVAWGGMLLTLGLVMGAVGAAISARALSATLVGSDAAGQSRFPPLPGREAQAASPTGSTP